MSPKDSESVQTTACMHSHCHNTGCPASSEPVVDAQPLGEDALELDELLDLDPLVGHVCLRDVARAADQDRLSRVAVVARGAAGTAESVWTSVRRTAQKSGRRRGEDEAERRVRKQSRAGNSSSS